VDLIIPNDSVNCTGRIRKAMANGVSKYGSETLSVPAVTKDGERISIEFTITFSGRGRQGARPVAVVRDVTARWIREKELRRRLASLEAEQRRCNSTGGACGPRPWLSSKDDRAHRQRREIEPRDREADGVSGGAPAT